MSCYNSYDFDYTQTQLRNGQHSLHDPSVPPFNLQTIQQPFEIPMSSFSSESAHGPQAPHAPSHHGRKRKSPTDLAQEHAILPVDKRIRVTAPTVQPVAPICGVGPMEHHITGIPSESSLSSSSHHSASETPQAPSVPSPYASLRQNQRPTTGAAIATDVWYFCRAETTDGKSATPLEPAANDDILTKKPKSPFVSCKLCKARTVYKNADGITTTIRHHLLTQHKDIYLKVVSKLGLKHANDVIMPGRSIISPSKSRSSKFDHQEWIRLMIKWIVRDDQAINVVEGPDFRRWALYGRDNITDSNLPHRTKLIELIHEAYEEENMKMVELLKSSLGRISFTSDCWSDINLVSFLALTAHFVARDSEGHLVLRNRLVAFRIVKGKHDGENLAQIIFGILKKAAIENKIGQFTLDNASNNNTLMVHLEKLFSMAGIKFHHDGNRIRCFPHIINIAVTTMIKRLKDNPYAPVIATCHEEAGPSEALIEYAKAVKSDPIGTTVGIVAVCRKSGQRRAELQQIIFDGNHDNVWPDGPIRPLQLLRQCETRWSSTFNMISRCIELYPAIEFWFGKVAMAAHSHLCFTMTQFQVLHDIHQILEAAHRCQELLSSAKCPTLSWALPAYEKLVTNWTELQTAIPELAHYIGLGIGKIMEYVSKGRRSRIYALAMIVNPKTKFQWMERHWLPWEVAQAEGWMIDAMLDHLKAKKRPNDLAMRRNSNMERASSQVTSSSTSSIFAAAHTEPAAHAQARGFTQLSTFSTTRRTVSLPSVSRSASICSSRSTTPISRNALLTPVMPELAGLPAVLTEAEKAIQEEEEHQKDLCAVQNALYRWKMEPLIPEDAPLDLVQFWDSCERTHPLLFPVALDVLPVQASAVPCERVFSSSKETCTLRRNLLSPTMMEMLQFLKHIYQEENLDFTSHHVAKEEDYAIDYATEHAINELIAAGNEEELRDLLISMEETAKYR